MPLKHTDLNVFSIGIGVTSTHTTSIVECLTLRNDLSFIQIRDIRIVHEANGHVVQSAVRIIDLVNTLEQDIPPPGILVNYFSSKWCEDAATWSDVDDINILVRIGLICNLCDAHHRRGEPCFFKTIGVLCGSGRSIGVDKLSALQKIKHSEVLRSRAGIATDSIGPCDVCAERKA